MALKTRDATGADVAQIRDLQIASWRDAYRGLLPTAFLEGEVETVLGARWAALPDRGWDVLVVYEGARLAGFASVDLDRGQGAYVDNLHVADWARGRGVGRTLMAEAARRLLVLGVPMLWLTVMRENHAARAFYARIGGQERPGKEHLLYGNPVFSLPVEWPDLPRLAALADHPSGQS